MPGRDVRDHLGDEEGIEARACFGVVATDFLLEGAETTDTRGDDDPDTVLVHLLYIELGVSDRLFGRYHSELGIAVEATCLLAINVLGDIEVLYLAGKLRLELRGVEEGDRTRSALASDDGFPRLASRSSER